MTTVVVCNVCEQIVGRPHEAVTVHLPDAGLIFHVHDKCLKKLDPTVKKVRKAVKDGPEVLEELRRQHMEEPVG